MRRRRVWLIFVYLYRYMYGGTMVDFANRVKKYIPQQSINHRGTFFSLSTQRSKGNRDAPIFTGWDRVLPMISGLTGKYVSREMLGLSRIHVIICIALAHQQWPRLSEGLHENNGPKCSIVEIPRDVRCRVCPVSIDYALRPLLGSDQCVCFLISTAVV